MALQASFKQKGAVFADPRDASPANAAAPPLAPEVIKANLMPENNNMRFKQKTDREVIAEILVKAEKEKARTRKLELQLRNSGMVDAGHASFRNRRDSRERVLSAVNVDNGSVHA